MLFSEVKLKDIMWYLRSRRFKRFVASNTYNILSILVILATLIGLSYKFGYFDGILNKKPTEVVVQEPDPIVEEPIVKEIEPEIPTTRAVVKPIYDIYNFTNRLEV